jgi:UDP-GlcNAc:undecaprenyl-phosphate GlcNAc-1-phosphate transferase
VTFGVLEYLVLGLATFVLSTFLTWPVRALAIRIGFMDRPNLERKTQENPVPYLGGVAIALSVTVVTSIAIYLGDDRVAGNESNLMDLAVTLFIPALLMLILGLVDDLRSLSAVRRLITQSALGIVVACFMITNGSLGTPFGNSIEVSKLNWNTDFVIWLNVLVTIVWIVGICNSINFFDNLDGAASGVVAIAALGVFVIAIDRGQELIGALSIVTLGGTVGFLMWNKSPAKIYMGDGGAMFLGIVISVLTIRLNPGITPIWHSLAIPVMLLAVPLLDTCVAVFSRLSRGLSPLTGGRDHLSHRLVRGGLTRPMAAISLWSASGVSALFALGVYFFTDSLRTILIAVFAVGWFSALTLFLRTPSQD